MQESMEKEGQELAKASFGPTILLAIGKAYEGQAAIHLGGFFQGSLVSLKQEGHSIKSKVPSLPHTPAQTLTLTASHSCTHVVCRLLHQMSNVGHDLCHTHLDRHTYHASITAAHCCTGLAYLTCLMLSSLLGQAAYSEALVSSQQDRRQSVRLPSTDTVESSFLPHQDPKPLTKTQKPRPKRGDNSKQEMKKHPSKPQTMSQHLDQDLKPPRWPERSFVGGTGASGADGAQGVSGAAEAGADGQGPEAAF